MLIYVESRVRPYYVLICGVRKTKGIALAVARFTWACLQGFMKAHLEGSRGCLDSNYSSSKLLASKIA